MIEMRKLLYWEGSSKKELKAFPVPVQKDMGVAVHVLHAFQKKSKSGVATPRPDVALIGKRLKAVLDRHAASGRT